MSQFLGGAITRHRPEDADGSDLVIGGGGAISSQPSAFTVLRDFIRSRMRMSPIYQPIMLRTL